MHKIQRVMTAIEHREPDRVPKGELGIARELAEALLKEAGTPGTTAGTTVGADDFQRNVAVRKFLNIDLVSVGDWGPNEAIGRDSAGNRICRTIYGLEFSEGERGGRRVTKPALQEIGDFHRYKIPDTGLVTGRTLGRFVSETDFFVFGQLSGPLDTITNLVLGFEDYMITAAVDAGELALLTGKLVEFEIAKAEKFLDLGAHAILIGDDIAYNTGLFVSADLMGTLVFPFWRKMVRDIKCYKDVPVFLHSDGDINAVMDEVVSAGFDGVQSLQPSAGMDIASLKKRYGARLCLMGNLDLNNLLSFGTPAEVARVTEETIRAAALGGGYILSTCNVLTRDVPPANALAMYRTADRAGRYPIEIE